MLEFTIESLGLFLLASCCCLDNHGPASNHKECQLHVSKVSLALPQQATVTAYVATSCCGGVVENRAKAAFGSLSSNLSSHLEEF